MNKGFSLIEMLAVVAIISIIALMGGVMTSRSSNAAFNNDVATMQDVFWRARNWARNHNVCTRINVTGQQIDVSSFVQSDCSVPFLGATTPVYTVTLNAATQISAFLPSSPFVFNQNGGTIYNQPGTMTLQNTSGKIVTFTVYPVIGQVRVR